MKFLYGGQAVLEGVMIRGPEQVSIAVRRPDHTIVREAYVYESLAMRWPFLGLPLIRGAAALFDALRIGIGALLFSANQTAVSEEEELTAGEIALSTGLAFLLAITLFVLLPTGISQFVGRWLKNTLLLNLFEGTLRIGILIAYVAVIPRMDEMRRVLEYHGAEHKVIHALEAGVPLQVEQVQKFPIEHPRCGTSFLLLVALTSVLLFSLFGWPGFWLRIGLRLALLPVVAGIAYELIRASAQGTSPLWRPILLPGLWLQRFTTRQPDDEQVAVALAALQGALAADDYQRAGAVTGIGPVMDLVTQAEGAEG